MSLMSVDGYEAKIEYNAALDTFHGEILGLNGFADFFGKTLTELKSEFKKSLNVFLEVCAENNIAPHLHYSGKLNLRIAPDLHERLAIVAQAEGKSLNKLAEEALALRVAA